MKFRVYILLLLTAAICLSSCASSEVTSARRDYGEEKLKRPETIIVHDFAATADEIPEGSSILTKAQRRPTAQTPEQIRTGKELAAALSDELVKDLNDMGMTAKRAASASKPALNDLVIKGAFVSIDPGDRTERVLIGFGEGAGELSSLVVVYQQTKQGLRVLGEGTLDAEGGKTPGMLAPMLIGIVTGQAAKSLVVSGGVSAVKELGPESMKAAAERTAQEISGRLRARFTEQGWIE